MKIATITCHDVYNFGASLQAYALAKYLKTQGYDTEIIDYVPSYLYHLIDFLEVDAVRWRKNWITRWAYRIRVFPFKLSRLKKYFAFKRFNKEMLPLSRKRYQTVNEIECDDYDILICGSDQIWNSTVHMCGVDPAFFLSFGSQDQKKISYAASFGGRTVSSEGEANIQKYLPGFHAVSVREESGVELLAQRGVKATQVVDPVFLLGVSQWTELAECPNEVKGKKYILAYGYNNSEDFFRAVSDAKERLGCQVITSKDPVFRDAGPKEFLGLVQNATLVVTTSFHAVAFSIIFHTPFVVAMTGNADLFERLRNILTITGLENRRYEELCQKSNWEREDIDFLSVDTMLLPVIEDSKTYLMRGIQSK